MAGGRKTKKWSREKSRAGRSTDSAGDRDEEDKEQTPCRGKEDLHDQTIDVSRHRTFNGIIQFDEQGKPVTGGLEAAENPFGLFKPDFVPTGKQTGGLYSRLTGFYTHGGMLPPEAFTAFDSDNEDSSPRNDVGRPGNIGGSDEIEESSPAVLVAAEEDVVHSKAQEKCEKIRPVPGLASNIALDVGGTHDKNKKEKFGKSDKLIFHDPAENHAFLKHKGIISTSLSEDEREKKTKGKSIYDGDSESSDEALFPDWYEEGILDMEIDRVLDVQVESASDATKKFLEQAGGRLLLQAETVLEGGADALAHNRDFLRQKVENRKEEAVKGGERLDIEGLDSYTEGIIEKIDEQIRRLKKCFRKFREKESARDKQWTDTLQTEAQRAAIEEEQRLEQQFEKRCEYHAERYQILVDRADETARDNFNYEVELLREVVARQWEEAFR